MERRKATFKLYPGAREAERLAAWARLHIDARTPGTGMAARPRPLAWQRAKSTTQGV
jgi:hypothetical protein